MIYFPQKQSDIEVIIKNNRPSKNNIYSGYRPTFKIKDDYLTSGIINLLDCEKLGFEEEAMAEIWFITPEIYPNCLKVGQIIVFQEGKTVHGTMKITKINNKVLEKTN